MANLAPAHAAFGLTNPNQGNLFPGYLTGPPALVPVSPSRFNPSLNLSQQNQH